MKKLFKEKGVAVNLHSHGDIVNAIFAAAYFNNKLE